MPRKRKTSEGNMGGNASKKGKSEEDIPQNITTKTRSGSVSSVNVADTVFNPTKCQQLFDKFKDPAEAGEMIGPEGIEKFCEELGVTPDNVIMLLISWKFGAAVMGYYSKEEWMSGMRKMNCDSIQKLKNHFPKLQAELNDPPSFKDLYRYSFDFSKEKGQKSLDIATAQAMLMLLLKDKSSHTESFIEFVQEKNPVKVMNKDQWMNFLEFCEAVAPDLSNYDENSAWPVLLDEYVTWKKHKLAGN